MRRSAWRVGAAVALLLFSGCDPGWSYVVPDATPVRADGLRFDLAGPAATMLRVYSSVFTTSLTVEIDIANVDPSPLSLSSLQLSVDDRDGKRLEPFDRTVARPCLRLGAVEVARLAQNESCQISRVFRVEVGSKRYDNVVARVEGVSRAGQGIPIVVPLRRR